MTRKRLKLIAAVSALSMTMTSVLPAMAAPAAADDSSRNTSGNETADISPVMELEFEGNTDDTARADRQVSVKKWVENESVAAEEDTDYSYVDGVIGDHALQLNGSAYVSLGEEADLNPENLTFSMWINPQEELTGEHILVWNKDAYTSDGWYLSSQDADVLILSIGTRIYEVHLTGKDRSEFFPAGEWTHIAVTFDDSTKEAVIYRNGEVQMTSTGEEIDEIKDSGVDKALGYNGPTHKGAYLKAQIDQAVILDEAVDQTVIQELYQERQTGDGGSGDEEEGLTGQVLDLEFEDNLTDGTGKNTDIQISGSGYSYVDGQNSGKALSLNGANTYVDLGNNTELQPDKLTLSFWIKPNGDWGSGEQVIAWNKNEYTTDGWYLSSENAETPLALSAGREQVSHIRSVSRVTAQSSSL